MIGLQGCTILQALNIAGSHCVVDVQALSDLGQLKKLHVDCCERLASLKGIQGCTQLQQLRVHHSGVSSIEVILGLVQLEYLGMSYTSVDSLEALSTLTRLEWLDASYCKQLSCPEGAHSCRG